MELNGSEILMETLLEQEVEVMFGYPGGAILNIHDALYKYKDKMRHIVTSHEQGACHAADGYARISNKVGVVLATSGPGATNIVTGLANAYMDSIPLVAITGNVMKPLIGRDSFQEIDIAGITMPITKINYIVEDVTKLADTVREAFKIAMSGRPGPVLIDIPKDVTADICEFEPKGKVERRALPEVLEKEIAEAIVLIEKSEKPLIYAGGGVVFSDASESLVHLAEKLDASVTTSMMGLSAIPHHHPLNLGMIGMHGTPVANRASVDCDLLIAVGARFDDRVAGNREKFAKNAKIIHIDIDPSEHCKNVVADLCIYGDSKKVMEALCEAVAEQKHRAWITYLESYKQDKPLPSVEKGAIQLRNILNEIESTVSEDAIIVTDVGQHQMITAQQYKFKKPRTFVSSCGLGTMGFGLGAAIGAKVAKPEAEVILVTGDGSFHMNMTEMACLISEGLDIKIVMVNNHVLGMVRQWQKMFYQGRYSNVDIRRKTDFVKVAEAFGMKGYLVEKEEDLKATIQTIFKEKEPALMEFVIDEEEGVFPIIPPGGSAKDIILKH